MHELRDKKVLIIGLGTSGQAAARLARSRGAKVTALDQASSEALRKVSADLQTLGIQVALGTNSPPEGTLDLAVLSPGVPRTSLVVRDTVRRGIPLIGELELGFQQSLCLNVAITGTNGKTTTTELVERILTYAHRKTVAAGNIGLPLCAVADQAKDLDFLTLEVSSFQLETIHFFRPAVAVLMNVTPDHLDRYPSYGEYLRAKARLFENQQAFDWAIIQSEALAQLRSAQLHVPSKVITFSANNRRADLFMDRGLLISQIPDWTGLLLDMDDCPLRGPHNAENVMAAMAVGRVLRIPLEQMVAAIKTYQPAAHRCEQVAELDVVVYVNDSKATNVDAVAKALLAVRGAGGSEPNVHLIAGGKDKGFDFHDIGPLLATRVKRAYLLGETREKIRAAWSLFTPCTLVDSMADAVKRASEEAVAGDVVLLSPACSSFDMFQSYGHRGEVFRQTVRELLARSGAGAVPSGSAGSNHQSLPA